MGINILDRIQARLELFRLEQRYTRRRSRRCTFVSNAVYVDGEYIYNTPHTTGSSLSSATTAATATSSSCRARARTDDALTALASESEASSLAAQRPEPAKARKKLMRLSSMPGFGSSSSSRAGPGS